MTLFTALRMLAWMKRIALSLESIAASQRAIVETATAVPQKKKAPKLGGVYNPSIAEMNAEWQAQRDEEMFGSEIKERD